MKKILQDLSYAELEALVLSMGEKKFRAKQLYEGLMQGKKISDITSLSKVFKEKDLLFAYPKLFPTQIGKQMCLLWWKGKAKTVGPKRLIFIAKRAIGAVDAVFSVT